MTQEKLNNTLHTLNKTQSVRLLNAQLSQCISAGDSVILIEDGVYQCINLTNNPNTSNQAHWSEIATTIYVLSDDAKARGVPTESIQHTKISFINYHEFVSLSLKYKKVVSWY